MKKESVNIFLKVNIIVNVADVAETSILFVILSNSNTYIKS
jgi:hypothetical protein